MIRGTLFLLAPAQFFLQLDETALRHRYLINHFLCPSLLVSG